MRRNWIGWTLLIIGLSLVFCGIARASDARDRHPRPGTGRGYAPRVPYYAPPYRYYRPAPRYHYYAPRYDSWYWDEPYCTTRWYRGYWTRDYYGRSYWVRPRPYVSCW